MGFGFAGALAGGGGALLDWATERQKLADDLLKQKQAHAQRMDAARQGRAWDVEDRDLKYKREDESRERAANVYESLFGTESGGNFNADNGEGYGGRSQFGQARLDDWSSATGAPRISVEQFRRNKDLQKEIEQWHFGDIKDFIQSNGFLEKYEGQTIGGVPITESGMIAAAHIGGKNGLKRFLESGGKYDPEDSNGTSISDYMRTHGGLSTDMAGVWEVLADPSVPASMKTRITDRITGEETAPSLTGEEWVDQGDGTETLMGRVSDSNRMAPYTGPDGKPITRKKERIGFSQGGDMTARDRDDLSRMYRSFREQYEGDVAPTEAQFIAYVQSSRKDGEDLAAAADRAAREWTEETVIDEREVPRAALSPFRLFGDDTYTESTARTVGGFGSATTPQQTPPPADTREAAADRPAGRDDAGQQEYPPAPRDPAQREVGQIYRAPNGMLVRWTGEGWEKVNG